MPPTRKRRSAEWFSRQDIYGFIYRSWVKNRGVPQDQFDGRPVIGICNTWSELTPCNTHFRVLAEHVRNGILESGGFPLEFPVMSLGETLLRPTAMLYRNLASMDVEESIRGNPIDGVVLDRPVPDGTRLELNGRVMRTGAASLLSEDTDPTAAVTVFAISDIENLVGMSED